MAMGTLEVLMDEQLNSKSFKLQLAAVQIASLCLGGLTR